jgi:hypothetical protein
MIHRGVSWTVGAGVCLWLAVGAAVPRATGQATSEDAAAFWYRTRGEHAFLGGDLFVYTVSRHNTKEAVEEWRAAKEPRVRMVPFTELWGVSLTTLERRLLAAFIEDAQVAGLERAEEHEFVRVKCSSVGFWAGYRGMPGHVLALPWLEPRTFRYDPATGSAEKIPESAPARDRRYAETSADGRTIAYVGEGTDKRQGVWLRDQDTGQERLLLEGGFRQRAHFNRSSTQLLMALAQGYGGDADLAIIDAETGAVKRLGLQGGGPMWSPDDARIAYSAGARGGDWCRGIPADGHLFIADADGNHPFELTPPDRPGFSPRWSPDGLWVAYLCATSAPEDSEHRHAPWDLRVVSTGDDEQDVLVAAPCGADFIWTADSKGLVTFGEESSLYRLGEGGKVTSTPLVPGAWDHPRDGAAAAAIGQAGEVLRQATADYNAGQAALDGLQLQEGRRLVTGAAEAFGSLPTRFPAARFVQADLDLYVQHIRGLATASDEDVKYQVAWKRLDRLSSLLWAFRKAEGHLPPDLTTLRQWAADDPSYAKARDEVPTWFRDPDAPADEALSLDYAPEKAEGPRPATLVTNPRRPGIAIILNDRDQLYLEVKPRPE